MIETSVRRQRQNSNKRCKPSEAPPKVEDMYSNEMPPRLGDNVDESLKAARRRTLEVGVGDLASRNGF